MAYFRCVGATRYTSSVTLVVHGAQGDNIAIYDDDYNIVGSAIFESNSVAAQITIDITPNNYYTFISSIAKAIEGGTMNYSKRVQLSKETHDVYVMPDNALYWYGNELTDITGGWTKAPKWSEGEFTKYLNYIRSKATQTDRGIFTNAQAIDFRGYNTLHIDADVAFNKSGDNGSFEIEIYADSALNTRLYSNGDIYTASFSKTLKRIDRDISSVNNSGYFGIGAYNNSGASPSQITLADVYRIWLD